jgi:hypothetical protein
MLAGAGPAWGEEALKGIKFKRISVRCPHCTKLGRKNPSMSSRLIPIRGALVGNGAAS